MTCSPAPVAIADSPLSPAPAGPGRGWFRRRLKMGITLRTALLAWLVTIVTILIFAISIVPALQRTLLDYLHSKANGVAVSLREVAAGAAVSADYSSVVDHCVEMLKGDAMIDYIVLTRYDGFSLIHDRKGWRTDTLGAEWRPQTRIASGAIVNAPLFERRVYHFSQPFDYSGIGWGWIHVGLSVEGHDRDIAELLRRIVGIGVVCIVLGFAATLFYAKYMVRPILALERVVRRVSKGDLSARAPENRTDELGDLATSINSMTEALLRRDRTLQEANESLERRVNERTRELRERVAEHERTHRALEEAQNHLIELSRDSGRAEIATGVLHSVGNVLNSVNVSATLVHDQLSHSHLRGLLKAARLVKQNRERLDAFLTQDAKGRHLAEYLMEVSEALSTEHAAWKKELDALSRNIGHIKEIVAMQQSYARVAGVTERLSTEEVVNDAIRANEAAYQRSGIEIERDFCATTYIVGDRHKLLLILVNLLTNAQWATEKLPRGHRHVRVSLRHESGRVRIEVTDNGVGITAQNMPRIFRHGFTTRESGHGFGLHIGALAARELGGSLSARSDGPERGATFTLDLPATPAPA